jgi:signal transduction histidine kinase
MGQARILVAEDESIVAQDIKGRLESLGYSVCATAVNGYDAVKLARDLRPDLALMDIRLEGEMDGIRAAEQLVELDVPVVFLTGYQDAETFDRAKKSGAAAFLVKPYQEHDLRYSIDMVLHKHARDKEVRGRLLYTEKLFAMGRIIMGQEFREQVNAIRAQLQKIRGSSGENPAVVDGLEAIERHVSYTDRIIENILALGDAAELVFENVDIVKLLRRSIERFFLPEHVTVKTDFDPDVFMIRADPIQLGRIFLNILSHAVAAMPDGGELSFAVRREQGRAQVVIRDTGDGHLFHDRPESVFNPLLRVHQDGVGLGLVTARILAEGHGGSLEVSGSDGQGTTIRLSLPVGTGSSSSTKASIAA